MDTLQTVLAKINPYAAAYKHMHQVEKEERRKAAENNTPVPDVRMYFKRNANQKRYNTPTHDEIAAVFVGEDGMPPFERDIVIHPHNQPAKRISHLSANVDPMTYPILFPRGDLGWSSGLLHEESKRTRTRKTITHLQFYSHRLAIRNQFSPIHRAGKLFQQYIVDAYVKTESNRLNFVRQNQTQLRVEKYQGLMDQLQSQATASNQRL